MKRRRILPLIVVAFLGLTGCNASDAKADGAAYEKIQNALLTMESYQAEASVKYISNKNTHTYDTLQQCKMTGQYRIEVTGPEKVAGNVTLCDGKAICQFNPKISGKISITTTESPERSEIFLTSFVENYVKSQEVSISASTMDESVCTVLEAKVPGEHPYLSMEKLWVDNKTLKPVQLVIYDPDGGERIVVSYKTFEYNVVLDDNLFIIQ